MSYSTTASVCPSGVGGGVKRKRYVLNKKFEGAPNRCDFELVEEELPPLKKNEVLFQSVYLSVDPYMRIFAKPGSTMIGTQVSKVLESNHCDHRVGDFYFTNFGWVTHEVIDPKHFNTDGNAWRKPYNLKVLGGIDLSHSLGGLGMPGLTGSLGLIKVCDPKPGEFLVVTGAAGAVGSVAGQMGKILGMKVIGFTGTDEKVKILLSEFKFDHAFNYKNCNTVEVLRVTASCGVDCFFDNVGGLLMLDILSSMKDGGRVCICGSISSYNDADTCKPSANSIIKKKKLKVEQFYLAKYGDECVAQQKKLIDYYVQGKLVLKQTVYEGFEKMIDAFLGLFSGLNTGKMIVRI